MQEVKVLGEELLREPVKRVNHVAKLLKVLAADPSQASSKSALKYLKLFFLAAFETGNLAEQNARASSSEAPQEKLRTWVRQKYEVLCEHLLGMLQLQDEEALQVSAVNSILELARGQQVGVFNHSLFARACTVVLQQSAVSHAALELLTSKYLPFADVRCVADLLHCCFVALVAECLWRTDGAACMHRRYYTLQAMHKAAESAQSQVSPPADPLCCGTGALTGEQAGRRMFELLSAIAPTLAPDGEQESVPSWCGATEAGLVGAAPAHGEGSHQRRKRKREAASGDEGPVLGSVQWANPAAYKRAFSDVWLGLLRLPLPSDLLKQVLVQLHGKVMASLPNPLLLSDFLSSCLDQGGLIGMLALNGIFTLVTRHGLEYPHFYAQLYALLQAPVFRAKYRARFLQLADIFLSSGMVPAYTAAAFIKKFARLALTAPPAGAVIAIAFIHNLLRRHPSCSVLVNRPAMPRSAAAATAAVTPSLAGPTLTAAPAAPAAAPAAADKSTDAAEQHVLPHAMTNGHARGSSHDADSSDAEEADTAVDTPGKAEDRGAQAAASTARATATATATVVGVGGEVQAGEDVFDENELDPAKCRAIESSLWELESLRHHYYHVVANYVSILDKDLGDRKKTAEVDVGALLRSSYSECFAVETERRLKSVPVAFFPLPPTQLFPSAAKPDFSGWVC